MTLSSETTADRPLVYIAGGLTKAREKDLATYKDIRDGCRRAGFASYLPHEDTGSRQAHLDPLRVYEANIAAVNRSVAIVANLAVASHGVGMEIQHAFQRGIPVVAIAPARADISKMLRGHPSLSDRIYRYQRSNTVSSTVERALSVELRGEGVPRRRLISIEGPDGVGKSTTCRAVLDALKKSGRPVRSVTDPPWNLPPWDQLSSVFRTDERLSALAEALLFGTARVDNYAREIKNALETGEVVICDRYIDSWFAYQSVRLRNRGFQHALEFLLSQQTLLESHRALEPPSLTILLSAQPRDLTHRLEAKPTSDKWEKAEFLEAVARAYADLHDRFPYRIMKFETTGRSPEDVTSLVIDAVQTHLGDQGGAQP